MELPSNVFVSIGIGASRDILFVNSFCQMPLENWQCFLEDSAGLSVCCIMFNVEACWIEIGRSLLTCMSQKGWQII